MLLKQRLQNILNSFTDTASTMLARLGNGEKSLVINRVPDVNNYRVLVPGSNFNYSSAVGNTLRNSAVLACINWIKRKFPEAQIGVEAFSTTNQKYQHVPNHPLTLLINKPNRFYSGLLLWQATLTDYNITGNAYWLKVRNRLGKVVELWYIPSFLIEPYTELDSPNFVDYYRYNNDRVAVEDIVHFRFGLDSENITKGLSPLMSAIREVFMDNEATNFGAALLRNMGIPGIIISPEFLPQNLGVAIDFGAPEAKAIKDEFKNNFTGDKRGDPLVTSTGLKVIQLSFTPEQMNLKELHRLPEERISAVLGVPAVVAGLGAGLDRSTFANMQEAREMAVEANILPTQQLFCAELNSQLLYEFEESDNYRTYFDNSAMRELQQDLNALHERARNDYQMGIIKRSEAREMTGRVVTPEDEIYVHELAAPITRPEWGNIKWCLKEKKSNLRI